MEETMAERSPEIEQFLRDTAEAMERGDVETIERRTSREDYAVAIGSDASEWAQGYDDILRLWRESTPEGAMQVHSALDDVVAYQEGSVGWGAGRGWFEVEGQRVPVRLTVVVHRENDEWKAVQSHASIGVPNDRMFDPMFQTRASV
jgi:ketosteroid isomerase-like protein